MKKRVVFSKPMNIKYLDDLSFTENIGVKFKSSGKKAMVIPKNEMFFYLVTDNIPLDMNDYYKSLKDVCSEEDEVLSFDTFEELCSWVGEKN